MKKCRLETCPQSDISYLFNSSIALCNCVSFSFVSSVIPSGSSTVIFGSIPTLFILFLFGVQYSSVVVFSPLPSDKLINVCITPFPYVFVPIIVAFS